MAKRLARDRPAPGAGRRRPSSPTPVPGEASRAQRAALTWRQVLTSAACLFGVGVATYLTISHYSSSSLTCPFGGTGAIDCAKVTTSPESFVFGIPVAVLGLAFFVPMLALCLPAAWRSANRYVAPLRLASAVVSIGFVFYLVHAELFVIHAICIWCTAVHVLTFVVFVAVVTGWDEAREPYRERLEAA